MDGDKDETQVDSEDDREGSNGDGGDGNDTITKGKKRHSYPAHYI